MHLVIFSLIVLFTWYKIRWWHQVKYIDKIPGPPTFFISTLGNIHQVWGSTGLKNKDQFYQDISLRGSFDWLLYSSFQKQNEHLWNMLRTFAEDYYPIYRGWLFEEATVTIRHPDDAEIFLSHTKNITKGPTYDFLHSWLGTGLLTSTGQKWKNRRKILTPAFHFNVLHQFVEVFNRQAKLLVNVIQNSEEECLDVIPVFTNFTLNTICETALGTHLTENIVESSKFRKAVHYMGNVVFNKVISPWSRIKWLLNCSPCEKGALKILHEFSTKIIEKRKEYHETHEMRELDIFNEDNESSRYKDESVGTKKKVALLDLLIQVWKSGGIDDRGIREEVDTFVFEGHDTTSGGLIFTILLLAEHEEAQERARAEVNEVLDKSKGTLGITELNSLVYLERCIKEALRLYPSVPTISRTLSEDVRLGGYMVPEGTTVNLMIYDLHRDPNFWPNPHNYDPDRFLPEKIRNRHPYSYVPFSAGSRNCIGQKFAMLELKSVVAHLLHNFDMEAVDKAGDTRLVQDLIIRSAHPLRVIFSPITKL